MWRRPRNPSPGSAPSVNELLLSSTQDKWSQSAFPDLER
jgi:hypothetical protein